MPQLDHVAHTKSICERGQTDENEKWNPNPQLLDRAKKKNKDDAVENRSDVSIGDSEGPGESCVSDGFTSFAKDRTPEMSHGPALVEAYV